MAFDYLLYNSSHPQRCKDSISYSQFLRVRRICTRVENFERHVLMLGLNFLRRGYPEELVIEAALSTRDLDRKTLLQLKERKQELDDKVTFVTTFHPSDRQLRHIVSSYWAILGQSPTTKHLYNRKN